MREQRYQTRQVLRVGANARQPACDPPPRKDRPGQPIGRLSHAAWLAQQLEGVLAGILPQARLFDQITRQQMAHLRLVEEEGVETRAAKLQRQSAA